MQNSDKCSTVGNANMLASMAHVRYPTLLDYG